MIISSHAGDIISACKPEELVVLRRLRDGRRVSRVIAAMPIYNRERTLRMAQLHLDATRSASLFAERLIITEGVTEGLVLRQLGRAWAGTDDLKCRFIEALTITVMGSKVGRWPVDLLATPEHEIAGRVAVFTDTDKRPPEVFTEPNWISSYDAATVQVFYNEPTLEPAITPGNEEAVRSALAKIGIELPDSFGSDKIDSLFADTAKKRKGEFALAFADELMRRMDAGETVSVPEHVAKMFDFLYAAEEHEDADAFTPDL